MTVINNTNIQLVKFYSFFQMYNHRKLKICNEESFYTDMESIDSYDNSIFPMKCILMYH